MQRVNEALFDRLRRLLPEGVSVYPCVAEEDAAYPYCVYNAGSFTSGRTKQGVWRYVFSYKVDIWGRSFNEVDTLAGLLMEQLDGEIAERMEITLAGGTADYADGGYVQSLDYELRYYPPV